MVHLHCTVTACSISEVILVNNEDNIVCSSTLPSKDGSSRLDSCSTMILSSFFLFFFFFLHFCEPSFVLSGRGRFVRHCERKGLPQRESGGGIYLRLRFLRQVDHSWRHFHHPAARNLYSLKVAQCFSVIDAGLFSQQQESIRTSVLWISR